METGFPCNMILEDTLVLKEIADKYEVTGGNIINIADYATKHELNYLLIKYTSLILLSFTL